MPITPAEARRVARDYVVEKKGVSSDAKVRVSDFCHLAGGGYSVLVDVKLQTKSTTRYRVKMDDNGNVKSFVTR